MKCQHGQFVSKFCISHQCKYKTAASCHYCLKIHHYHIDHLETLTLKQVEDLVDILSICNATKYKQSTLKQLIVNYFQGLKVQIVKSIETVCKNMVDRVSHAYLSNQNMIQAYKKAKNKDFNKISAEQLRHLHLFNLKNTSINLQKQEQKQYSQQVLSIQKALMSIKNVFNMYKNQIQKYDHSFSSVNSFFYKKITDLTEKIVVYHQRDKIKQSQKQFQKQSQKQSQRQSEVIQINIKGSENIKNNPQTQVKNNLLLENSQPKLLSLEQYRIQKARSSSSLRSNDAVNLLNVSKMTKQRKVSINIENQIKSPRILNLNKSHREVQHINSFRNFNLSEISKSGEINSPINKPEQMYKKDKSNLNINNNQSFKLRQQKNVGNSIQAQQKYNNCSIRHNQDQSILDEEVFHWKQCNSVDLDEFQQENQDKSKFKTKKIHYPQIIQRQQKNHFDNLRKVQAKIIKTQFKQVFNQGDHPQSPLLKKKHQIQEKERVKSLKIKRIQSNQFDDPKYFGHTPQKKYLSQNKKLQEFKLAQNELKSLALLLQSINLPSVKALTYLRKSLQYCPQNLSSAEYLSYILIEQSHPKQCLQLCNMILQKTLNHSSNQILSVHILSNKAAALNSLGRFSEAIQFLQKITQHAQKDTIYKNLADAYCALGITEKSIQNYRKCIALNKQYDEAFYNLAVCFYSQHHFEQALHAVSEAIRLNSQVDEYIELYRNCKIKIP